MEKKSKKELRNLIQGAVNEAIRKLELPPPSKKILKRVDSTSAKLAALYKEVFKKEEKKKRKADKFLNEALHGLQKQKKKKEGKVSPLEPVEM